MDIHETFEKFNDEYFNFDSIKNKFHSRPDLCAFLLLDKLLPNDGRDMVCGAEHDEIFLDADLERLAEVATEEDVLTLTRCGVRYDSDTGSLAMFV
jgi:hypothetical protein